MIEDAELRHLMAEIAFSKTTAVLERLSATPSLARAALATGATRRAADDSFLSSIRHHVYAGDTALHVAAAAHEPQINRKLISLGAEVGAINRRGATPLHYAADGIPGSAAWNPVRQSETIRLLIEAGANPNARDKSGVTPLHRAVRSRCAGAVSSLLESGAEPLITNKGGSTPIMLAVQQTGRSGSGSPEAKAQQAEIISLFKNRAAAG